MRTRANTHSTRSTHFSLDMRNTEKIYQKRSNKVESNLFAVQLIFREYSELLSPALECCPNLDTILAHMLVLRLGWSVHDVDFTSKMSEWNYDDCRKVGRSMATIFRVVQQGNTAIESWRLHYPQLNSLFEITGFDSFMLVIVNNLLRDNIYGVMFRVGAGAVLSLVVSIDLNDKYFIRR